MKLIIRDKSDDVTLWAAKYVIKRINAFNPGPDKWVRVEFAKQLFI